MPDDLIGEKDYSLDSMLGTYAFKQSKREDICKKIGGVMNSVVIAQKAIAAFNKEIAHYDPNTWPESLKEFHKNTDAIKSNCYATIAHGYETLNDNGYKTEDFFKETKVKTYFNDPPADLDEANHLIKIADDLTAAAAKTAKMMDDDDIPF